LSSGSKVALKKICIPKDSALDSELNEALISMSLKHKNIVETYEYFVSKKNEFIIIMELC
jgi:serine/threonine protein kinase